MVYSQYYFILSLSAAGGYESGVHAGERKKDLGFLSIGVGSQLHCCSVFLMLF